RAEALKLLPAIFGLVDRAQKTGLIHKNAANRKKSRLSIKVKKLK
ncbi:MAG: 30S ribosomal protein S20, partial [Holophagaceae bacterium]